VGRAALGGPTGDKLMELLGIGLREYVRSFRRLNLIQCFPGKSGRGDSFPAAEAREAWRRLGPNLKFRNVILLGAKVADIAAPAWRAYGWCHWFNAAGIATFVLPHPSGLNHWWNDPANKERASHELRKSLGLTIAQCSYFRCYACGSFVERIAGVPRTVACAGGGCPMWLPDVA